MRQNETIIKHSTWYKRGQNETISNTAHGIKGDKMKQ